MKTCFVAYNPQKLSPTVHCHPEFAELPAGGREDEGAEDSGGAIPSCRRIAWGSAGASACCASAAWTTLSVRAACALTTWFRHACARALTLYTLGARRIEAGERAGEATDRFHARDGAQGVLKLLRLRISARPAQRMSPPPDRCACPSLSKQHVLVK